jgi:FixJ family two-component response regulator
MVIQLIRCRQPPFGATCASVGTPLQDSKDPITVYIIDDDECVRRALARVFKSVGFRSFAFSSTEEFMAANHETHLACVLSDVHIVGEEPAELPRFLRDRHIDLPVIFMSADNTEENLAKVNRAGGVGFFRKPVDDQALIDAVKWAIQHRETSH